MFKLILDKLKSRQALAAEAFIVMLAFVGAIYGGVKMGANVDHSTTNIHGGHTLVVPGDSLGGFMSGADKTKLDGLGLTMKGTAKAFSKANIASLSGLANTVDGVAINTDGDEVCSDSQTTTTQDGCWIAHSGAWTRASELAVGNSTANAYVVVPNGTSNKGVWVFGTGTVGSGDLAASNAAAGGGGGGVTTFNTRSGAVVPASGDYTLNQIGAATSAYSLNGQRLTSVGDPTGTQDALTFNYYTLNGDPNSRVEWRDDFLFPTSATVTTGSFISGPGFYTATVTGTGAQVATVSFTSGVTDGSLQVKPGTTTTGLGAVSHLNTSTSIPTQLTAASDFYWSTRAKTEQLSNGTDTYTWNQGFFDTHTAAPANMVGFRHVNGVTNFQFIVCAASTCNTAIDTGVAVDTNYHRFEITHASGGNVIGKIDGNDVTSGGTTTNVPFTTNLADGGFMLSSAGTGAGRAWDVDWYHFFQHFGTPRAN